MAVNGDGALERRIGRVSVYATGTRPFIFMCVLSQIRRHALQHVH